MAVLSSIFGRLDSTSRFIIGGGTLLLGMTLAAIATAVLMRPVDEMQDAEIATIAPTRRERNDEDEPGRLGGLMTHTMGAVAHSVLSAKAKLRRMASEAPDQARAAAGVPTGQTAAAAERPSPGLTARRQGLLYRARRGSAASRTACRGSAPGTGSGCATGTSAADLPRASHQSPSRSCRAPGGTDRARPRIGSDCTGRRRRAAIRGRGLGHRSHRKVLAFTRPRQRLVRSPFSRNFRCRRRTARPDTYELPPLDLLTEPKPSERHPSMSMEALQENAATLAAVLDDFGVRGEIINVRPGPVVTLYELEPAPGTRSNRVIGLADDIARSMSAISARVALVAGRNAIGIELPNAKRENVLLREMLASQDFITAKLRSFRSRSARPLAAIR